MTSTKEEAARHEAILEIIDLAKQIKKKARGLRSQRVFQRLAGNILGEARAEERRLESERTR